MSEILKHRSPDRIEVFAEVLGWELYQIRVRDLATGSVRNASKPIIGLEYADIRVTQVLETLEGAYLPFKRVQSCTG